MTAQPLYRKWRRWLSIIEKRQIDDLMVDRHVFEQFRIRILEDEIPWNKGVVSEWVLRCYLISSSVSIRNVIEVKRQNSKYKTVSLAILLEDLASHDAMLTRDRFQRRFAGSVARRFVDGYFAEIAGRQGAAVISRVKIHRDLSQLQRSSKRIRKIVDKRLAHTEDLKFKDTLTLKQLNRAIDLIGQTYSKYRFLLTGRPYSLPEGHEL